MQSQPSAPQGTTQVTQDDTQPAKQQQSNGPLNAGQQLGGHDYMWQQQQQQQQQNHIQQQNQMQQHQNFLHPQEQQQQGPIGEVQQVALSTGYQQSLPSTAVSSSVQTSYTFGVSSSQPRYIKLCTGQKLVLLYVLSFFHSVPCHIHN